MTAKIKCPTWLWVTWPALAAAALAGAYLGRFLEFAVAYYYFRHRWEHFIGSQSPYRASLEAPGAQASFEAGLERAWFQLSIVQGVCSGLIAVSVWRAAQLLLAAYRKSKSLEVTTSTRQTAGQ